MDYNRVLSINKSNRAPLLNRNKTHYNLNSNGSKRSTEPSPKTRFSGRENTASPLIKRLASVYLQPQKVQRLIPARFSPYLSFDELQASLNKVSGYKKLDFKSLDNIQLKGYWLPSQNKPSNKTLVLGHGYYANATTLFPLAQKLIEQKLIEQNYNVFLFDFRAHGESQGKQSSLGFHEGKDIAAAIKTVKMNFPEQSQKLYYLGHSMAAAALMMTPESLKDSPNELNQLAKSLDGIILDSAYSQINLAENSFITQLASYSPNNSLLKALWQPVSAPIAQAVNAVALGLETHSQSIMALPSSLGKLKTAEIFKQHGISQLPLLLLHGKNDQRTDVSQSHQIKQTLEANRQSPLQLTLLNADHIADDWQALETKTQTYKSVLRDEENYLNTVFNFLTSH